MAAPRLRKSLSQLKRHRTAAGALRRLEEKRLLRLESLEDRRLMTQGPILVSVIPLPNPNSSGFLNITAGGNDTLTVAPRELTFRFAQGNTIDPTTLGSGFVVKSAGPDHVLGDSDDQTITPGFLGMGDTAREVIMRFASNLPDNSYSVTLVGAGLTPLKDTAGVAFNGGVSQNVNFKLDLGVKIDATVPQPVSRNPVTNALTQSSNTIDVYFDQQMSTTDVVKPSYYHLIDATTGAISLPQSVAYTENGTLAIVATGSTVLSFNGLKATSPLTVTNQTTRVTITNAGTNNLGTFTLTVNGATTAPIPAFGTTPATVLNALNAIPALKGNVAVVAGPGGLGVVEQFDITFQGTLTGDAVTVALTPLGQGTAGSVVTAAPASNFTAAAIQANLTTIAALNGRVTVTGPNGGPFNVTFTGSLAGQNATLAANNLATAAIGSTTQTLTLVSAGTTTLSYNGVNATSPLTVTTGPLGTTAANVQTNLSTIAALIGKVAVTGPAGGPFSITITAAQTGTGALVSSSAATATVKANSQLLSLVSNGAANFSFNGVGASSSLNVVTGATLGTTAAAVQAVLTSIPALTGNVTVSGPTGGPFTIAYAGTAAAANFSLIVTNPGAVVATVSQQPKATLSFKNPDGTDRPIPAGTYKLEVGTTPEPDDTIAQAQHIGNSMATPLQAVLGDNLLLTAANQANDVDTYRFDLANPVTNPNGFVVNVTPAAGSTLDPIITIYNAATMNEVQTLTLVSGGNTTLSFGGVNATSPLAVTLGASGTTATAVLNHLKTISALNGNVTVTGPNGGPFTITFGGSLGAKDVAQIASSQAAVATTATTNAGGPTLVIDAALAGAAESTPAGGLTLATGIYYVAVSSKGNSTGAYSIQATFGDLPATIDDTPAFDNSSFETATKLGTVGIAGKAISGANVGPSPNLSQTYTIQFPGAGDAPGDRNIPFESHIDTIPGQVPDSTAGVETITYNFQSVYGFTPQGNQFFNSITEAQKQRAREALELYARYLGVQFKEVSSDPSRIQGPADIADMTIATGDPRSIAPTISTGTGNTNNGVNGIAGVDSLISTANVAGLTTSVTGTVLGAVGNFISGLNSSSIIITSIGHKLTTGDVVQVKDVQGIKANGVWRVTVLDQDHFSLDGSDDNGFYLGGGSWTLLNVAHGVAVVNGLVNWGDSQYGGTYFQTVMHEIGHLLGLGDNFEAPALTIMGGGEVPSQASNAATAEPVFPGDGDIVYGQTVHRPESRDIDLYKFNVAEPGLFRGETIAERLPSSSLLNTVLTLYQETTDKNNVTTRTVIARNDDYYGNDSYLELHLDPGTYYVAVTSVGNTDFDPAILDSGFGGRTQGSYGLTMSLKPDIATTSMHDATGVAFDGDADGTPGGTYQFYFQSNAGPTAPVQNTIYVDKASTATGTQDGSLAHPYTNLQTALTAAGSPTTTRKIVRIVGNGGTDGDLNTFGDDKTYQVGFKDAARTQALPDGGQFLVPQNVTVMIDAGAAFKLRRTNLNAGTTPQGIVSTSGGSIQVLGTPITPVVFTSFTDDSVGGDNDGPSSGPQGGDFGGIVFRDDSDHERDFLGGSNTAINPLGLKMPVFLNYVNHASIGFGGGKVNVDSVEDTYDPIFMNTARPALSYNTIQQSANAGMSANPNAFDDDGLFPQIAFDNRRIGPDIHDNTITNNSINGLFINVRTLAGSPLDFVDLPTRWNDDDIVHIVSENLEIAGTPGGSTSPGADRSTTTLTDGRLRIDPGLIVKLAGARIETQISSQFIAEGTADQPIIFTSIKDDKYGGSGTFDTNFDPVRSGLITAATNATPIVITSANHGMSTGQRIHIEGVLGNTNANGDWAVTVIDSGHFSLDNSVGNGAYSGGGTWTTIVATPQPGDWGGLIFGAASSGSVAHAKVLYGGGVVPIEGGFDGFNAIEIHQADVRVADSVLQFNGPGGGNTDRNGRGPNGDAVIFIRGAQPVIVDNIIRDNDAPMISVNANAMANVPVTDFGQTTGLLNRVPDPNGNKGPLIRGNSLIGNRTNGMVVRGGVVTTDTVWDDTDIVHILFDEVVVPNQQVYGGLRLQSSPTESLVVKSEGLNAGITASGAPLDISDRIGGTVQIIGAPGFPVVLTSLHDCTVGAGFTPDGFPLTETINDCQTSVPTLPPFADVVVIMDESGSMTAAQQFSVGFIAALDAGLQARGIGTTTAGGNQFGLVGFGGAAPITAGHVFPVGPNNAPFGTSQQYATAAAGLVVNGDTEDGYSGLNVMFNNYVTRPNAAKFAILVTDEDRDVVNSSLNFNNTLAQLKAQGYNLEGILGTTIVDANNTRALALDSLKNAYVDNGAGGFNVSPNGRFQFAFGTTIADYANLSFATGGIVGDISQISQNPATANLFSQVLVSSIIAQASGGGAQAGDWRGLKLDQFSNDRNVAEVVETEPAFIGPSSAGGDQNRTPQTAQMLGTLAPDQKSADDSRRLGFQVDATIAYDNPTDVDVYSFNADSGTEAWIDIDRSSYGLDSMVELVDVNGNVIARATDTTPDVDDIHAVVHNITGATNGTPVNVTSAAHGLTTGDRIFITGVQGNTAANGAYTVTVVDADHFTLFTKTLQGTLVPVVGSGGYTSGGTWQKIIDPGLSGIAGSFDKDPYNGRDTYSTNAGPTRTPSSGAIVNATNSFPILIQSTAHGLITGDRVLISGVGGLTSANGVFNVTRADDNHFYLDGTIGNGLYTGGGTWTKLVATTRDPIMRVVLPKAANGSDLKNVPWFVRVRSQPAVMDGLSAGNNVNPGLTSGAYELQVRLQQQDEKPGSVIRFADIRYATNAIDIAGLPFHSPLAGETGEADDTGNNTFNGAQIVGNLLQVDRNTISIGGQLSNATDVDWYRFDLNFDLLQFVNGYTDGLKTWSSLFDIDYADGLSRPDTTLSVFDNTGHLLLVGRDSNVQDDQGTTATDLGAGTFGKHDALIGPAQLPAVVPGQTRTYYVAVTSDRMLPAALSQTFNPAGADLTDPTIDVSPVRLEPIDSIARVVDDPLESTFVGQHTGSQTAENPSNIYVDPNNPFDQPKSTLIDTTSAQSLTANVKPFTLADVPLFVSATQGGTQTQDKLFNIDASVGQAKAVNSTDFQTVGPLVPTTSATGGTDFNSGGAATVTFTATTAGSVGNNIVVNFTNNDLAANGVPTVTVTTPTSIDIVLDNNQAAIGAGTATSGTTAAQLQTVLQATTGLPFTFSFTGTPTTDISAFVGPVALTGGAEAPGPTPNVVFAARALGAAGNNIRITFNRVDRSGLGPQVQVNGSLILVTLDTNAAAIAAGTATSGTTLGQFINAFNGNAQAAGLVQVTVLSGLPGTDISNPTTLTPPYPPFTLPLTGGSAGTGSVEVQYGPRLTTSVQNDISDIAFRSDGQLFGYEGVNPATTNTAGALTLIDPGAGTSTTIGNDAIPDLVVPPPVPPTVASFNEVTTNLSAGFNGGAGQAALAWGGTVIGGVQNTLLYYSVPDPSGASRLYRADPTNGSAAVVQGQPWGRVGNLGIPSLLTTAQPATGQTSFDDFAPKPAAPVTVNFQTKAVGAGVSGILHFTASHKGVGVKPTTSLNNPPATNPVLVPPAPYTVEMNVDMNLDAQQAEATATYADATGSAIDLTYTADANNPGVRGNLGNDIVIQFSLGNNAGLGPKVSIGATPHTIVVILDRATQIGGTHAGERGTTALNLAESINNAVGNLVKVTFPAGALVNTLIATTNTTTPPASITLTGGASGSTAQSVIDAVSATLGTVGGTVSPVVVANLTSGNPDTVVALTVDPTDPNSAGKQYADAVLSPGSGQVGHTTGLSFGSGSNAGTLFGVTDRGQFLINAIGMVQANPANPPGPNGPKAIDVQLADPSNPAVTLSGASLRFEGLTRGPQNLAGGPNNIPGFYANMFFAITDTGILTALDAQGVPQKVFDADGDGIADSKAIQTGVVGGITGLSFSPFDFNLWHPTYERQGDAGHGIGASPTRTTGDRTTEFPSSGRAQDVANQSFYFGYEPSQQNPGFNSDSYLTYAGLNGSFPAENGQLGELNATTKSELSTNPQFSNTYDVPAGAYGSLITDNFSLASMSAGDKPTFYFDYFLDTQDINTAYPTNLMRDSARVYIGPFTRTDNFGKTYTTWDLVATNNDVTDKPGTTGVKDGELPTFQSTSVTALPANPRQQVQLLNDNTGEWRQARVDLSRYAGMSNLKLRFDFSTAGQMPDQNGHLPPVNSNSAFPPSSVNTANIIVNGQPTTQDYLFEDGFGNLTSASRGTNNNHQGFFIDNIIVGAAERGEIVTNAPVDTNFFDLYTPGSVTQPRNFDTNNPFPTQVLTGPYQLEMRRGAEYGLSDGGPLSGLSAHDSQTPILLLDTNDRLMPDQRTSAPLPTADFETGSFSKYPWNFTDDAPWTITSTPLDPNTNLPVNSGAFTAVSGTIKDGQSSGMSLDLITGNGNLTFGVKVDAQAADVLRLFVDGRLAQYTAINGVQNLNGSGVPVAFDAEFPGGTPYETITVPLAAGHHNFRWTYDKDATASGGQDKAFLDDIHFPAPQVGFQNIYEDPALNDSSNPNAASPPITPTAPPPSTRPAIRFIDTLFPGFTRTGDQNLARAQGHIEIDDNQIFASSQVGILVRPAPRDPTTNNPYPGTVLNLPTLNNERLVPGVTIANNTIANSGLAGIQYSGDPNTNTATGQPVPIASVPFGKIVNNTIYGGDQQQGIGVLVTNNAGPTLMNNIIANTITGVSVDPSSQPTTVIGTTLYANNGAPATQGTSQGTNPIFLKPGDPLFVNPANRNFYPAPGSQAVDSSLNTLADRPSIAAVESSIGISQAPILAPDRDLYGQLRLDDPSQSPPPGLGQNIFKDRGAVERADFVGPTAAISVTDSNDLDIDDDDLAGRDRDRNPSDMKIRNQFLTRFVIKLSDSGTFVDDSTVKSSQFTITMDGVPLVSDAQNPQTFDYRFVYNLGTNEAIFSPSAGVWALNHTYQITLNNTPSGILDTLGNPVPSGIFDLAGNPLEGNRPDGSTSFNIFVGTLYDFGDAPDPTYPTLFDPNNPSSAAAHQVLDGFHLGTTVTEENQALPTVNADGDSGDDGINFSAPGALLAPGLTSRIFVTAAIPDGLTGFLDAWIDLNKDGDWNDAGEKVLNHISLHDINNGGANDIGFTFGSIATPRGTTYARFRLSSAGTSSPTGIAPDGEVEDYLVTLTGPPYQNPNNRFDVNQSGKPSPSDALAVINLLNSIGPQSLPTPLFTPQGGGPGKALYVDVDGNTQLAPADALAVINFLNSQTVASGEGEGGAALVAASSTVDSMSQSSADAGAADGDTIIPPVLVASPGVELETRSRAPASMLAANQIAAATVSQDLALLAVGSESKLGVNQSALAKQKLADSTFDEESWEDLLTSLASDQDKKR